MSTDSQHHPAICWGKSTLCEHSALSDICDFHHGQPFDNEHRRVVQKNIPIVLILPSRWQDGAYSLGIERTSCLWYDDIATS